MNAWVESLHRIEANENTKAHTLWKDFGIPENIKIPNDTEARYALLGEAGRQEVSDGIHEDLTTLNTWISWINKATSHNLEQYTIYG
jgi:hypothetical protein